MLAKISRCVFGTALLTLLLCLPAQARQVEVSTSVLCNTEQQMERFVVLFDGNNGKAINGVNSEENDPHACVSGTIAYIRGPEIGTARNSNWTFNIVEVLVVAVLTEAGFTPAAPQAFFAAEPVDERIT
jgi:hypothetical protein